MSDNLARVIPLRPPPPPSAAERTEHAQIHDIGTRRRSRNGHHPDCPYQTRKVDNCGICASMRKGVDP